MSENPQNKNKIKQKTPEQTNEQQNYNLQIR